MAFLHGAFLGITLATVFGIGPAFFLLIQTSISKGFKYALLFDIGVLLSDAMVVALMMMTNIKLDFGDNDMILPGIAAGIIVIIFGVFTYRTKPEKIVKRSEKKSAELEEMEKKLEKFDQRLDMIDEKLDIKRKGPRWYIYISKGLVMNLFNPFVWIFWMTTVGAASGATTGAASGTTGASGTTAAASATVSAATSGAASTTASAAATVSAAVSTASAAASACSAGAASCFAPH